MGTLRGNSFETGIADGTAITGGGAGNSDDGSAGDALTNVVPGAGGTIAFSTTSPANGSRCAQFTQPTAANSCYVDITDTAADSFATRLMLNMSALPSGAEVQFPAFARSTGDSHVTRCQMTTGGVIKVLDTAGATILTSPALGTSSWYRIEYWGERMNTTNGKLGLALFAGNSDDPLYFEVKDGSITTTNTIGRIRWGKASNATLATWKMDDLAMNIGGAPGPIGPVGGWTQIDYGTAVLIG